MIDLHTDISGKIYDMTMGDLKELDFGSWKDAIYQDEKIATLQEAMEPVSYTHLDVYKRQPLASSTRRVSSSARMACTAPAASYRRGISCTRLDFALPVPPMMPSVSPGWMVKLISFSTG